MSNGYDVLAACYDAFTADVDYPARADYMESLFRRYGASPKQVLDLACGTGSLTLELSRRGYDMTGVDLSEEMLAEAYRKAAEAGSGALFIRQDMTRLDLYGTVEAALCCLDGINCLPTPEKLLDCFKRVKLFLEPGGLFIFDVNTLYKFEQVLAGSSFVYENDGSFVVWSNAYDPEKKLCDFQLTVFRQEGNGLWRRSQGNVSQRAYSVETLLEQLRRAGFESLEVLGDLSRQPPKEDEQRIYIVAR